MIIKGKIHKRKWLKKMNSNTGDYINAGNANWTFDGVSGKNFDSHIRKSIPVYDEGHDLVCKIADYYLSNDSICYELGCSTGTLLHKLATRNQDKKVQFIGVDQEMDMIEEAKKKCASNKNIGLTTSNIMDIEFKKSDLIIAYYTIQFVKPRQRQIIFDRIFDALNWGGALILFEKVRGPDARFQDISTSLYTDYKLDQGYTEQEIIAKSKSLKGVLEPFSTQGNIDLMKRAGFVDIMTVMKYVCFEGFLAIK